MLNSGEYHDGTTIGRMLNISRNAVCKAVNKLKNYGIEINSIKGKGYYLRSPLILLDAKAIKAKLNNQEIRLEVLESVDSTNNYIKPISSPLAVCLAEYQTHGKGRIARGWHSPFGQNIYLSVSYKFAKDISELAGLSLVISLAVVKTIKAVGLPSSQVKWPNDVLYNHKKLSGCLIEIQAEANGFCSAIIGVGVNVNMTDDKAHDISQTWTSLRELSNQYIDRNQLAAILINNITFYLEKFASTGLIKFIEEWQTLDYLFDKQITIQSGGETLTGHAQGINSQGQLLLKLKNGTIRAISSGDASINQRI